MGPGAGSEAGAVVALLTQVESPHSWSSVQAEPTPGGHELQLQITTPARSAEHAAQEVLDGVRSLLGLDAVFTRWVVDGRTLQVSPLPA